MCKTPKTPAPPPPPPPPAPAPSPNADVDLAVNKSKKKNKSKKGSKASMRNNLQSTVAGVQAKASSGLRIG